MNKYKVVLKNEKEVSVLANCYKYDEHSRLFEFYTQKKSLFERRCLVATFNFCDVFYIAKE